MTHTQVPAPIQNIKVKKALEGLKLDDSVQFRPPHGGEPILMRVSAIHNNVKNPGGPRLFIGYKKGKELRCIETWVTRVITRSVDNEEDWIDPKFVPDAD